MWFDTAHSSPSTNPRARWHWPQLTAITLLLTVRMGLIILWLTGGEFGGIAPNLSTRWAARASIIDLLLLAWVAYGWWVTHQWYLRVLLWPVAALWLSGIFWIFNLPTAAIAVFGSGCMGLGLALGVGLVRRLLSFGFPVFATAKALVDEAVHMKAAVGFMLVVALLVPILPVTLDPTTRLAYRLEMYLTWALTGSSIMLSLMTLFLACGSISFDISQRQIYLTLTKPVKRLEYILGKWLGLALLNVVLLGVTGLGIYAFARALEHQPDLGAEDRQEVETQILTARLGLPAHPHISQDSVEKILKDELQRRANADPDRYRNPDPATIASLRDAIERSVITNAYTLDPLGEQTFVFTNLNSSKSLSSSFQLRLTPQSVRPPPDGWVHLAVYVNDRPYTALRIADGLPYVVSIPTELINNQGRLELRLANVNPDNPQATFPSRIQFEPGKGLEVMVPVGRFEPNLVKALGILWFRLAYLAMLGLAAGALLSFPVACLVSLLVFGAAAGSGFITESLEGYVPLASGEASWGDWVGSVWAQFTHKFNTEGLFGAVKVPLRMIGDSFMAVVPSFGELNPVPRVSQGLWIGDGMVWNAFWKVGLVWTGVLTVAAWWVFRRRELARATG